MPSPQYHIFLSPGSVTAMTIDARLPLFWINWLHGFLPESITTNLIRGLLSEISRSYFIWAKMCHVVSFTRETKSVGAPCRLMVKHLTTLFSLEYSIFHNAKGEHTIRIPQKSTATIRFSNHGGCLLSTGMDIPSLLDSMTKGFGVSPVLLPIYGGQSFSSDCTGTV